MKGILALLIFLFSAPNKLQASYWTMQASTYHANFTVQHTGLCAKGTKEIRSARPNSISVAY